MHGPRRCSHPPSARQSLPPPSSRRSSRDTGTETAISLALERAEQQSPRWSGPCTPRGSITCTSCAVEGAVHEPRGRASPPARRRGQSPRQSPGTALPEQALQTPSARIGRSSRAMPLCTGAQHPSETRSESGSRADGYSEGAALQGTWWLLDRLNGHVAITAIFVQIAFQGHRLTHAIDHALGIAGLVFLGQHGVELARPILQNTDRNAGLRAVDGALLMPGTFRIHRDIAQRIHQLTFNGNLMNAHFMSVIMLMLPLGPHSHRTHEQQSGHHPSQRVLHHPSLLVRPHGHITLHRLSNHPIPTTNGSVTNKSHRTVRLPIFIHSAPNSV